MKRRSASSRHASSTRTSGAASNVSRWRRNPYASRISAAGRRQLTLKALAAELGPELAILAPDVAKAFPDSEAVNAALRAVLEASKVVRSTQSKRGRAPS